MTSRTVCPVCAQSCFSFRGAEKSKILIIGDEPSTDDRIKMIAMSGGYGFCLRGELDRAGIDLLACRYGYFLWHTMVGTKESEGCKIASIEHVLEEAKGRQFILLLGSKCVKYFTDLSVESVTGLRVTSQYLSCPNIMAGISPNSILAGTIGEFRFICNNFATMIGVPE